MWFLRFFSLVILFGVPMHAKAEPLSDDSRVASALNLLQRWLDAERAYHQIPGISVAIVHDQQLVWSHGFGDSDLEQKTPTTTKTIYSICSISKLFTSIAVLQLRDQGKLRLDDPVSDHLPWFDIQQAHSESAPVTIRGILSHSSGLPRESDFPYWTAPDFEFPSRQQIKEHLPGQKTLYPSATHFQYSNLGLTLAGEIVAKVSGQSYSEYVQTKILDPLALTDTRTSMPEEHRHGRLATGYGSIQRDGTRTQQPFFQAKGISPAAGFSSTVEDLSRFASWQFRLLANQSKEILNPNTLREMQRVHWLEEDWEIGRGLGFKLWRWNGTTYVGHAGDCPGYRSCFVLHPKKKIATIFMANCSGIDAFHYARTAHEIVAPAIGDATDAAEKAKTPDDALTKYAGTYDYQPWGGEIEVFLWEGELAMVNLPSKNPLNEITKLKHIKENLFKRIRDDDEPGAELVFEMDADGNVVRMKEHSNYWPRVR